MRPGRSAPQIRILEPPEFTESREKPESFSEKARKTGDTSNAGGAEGQANPRGRDTTQATTAEAGGKSTRRRRANPLLPRNPLLPPSAGFRKKTGEDNGTVAAGSGQSDVSGLFFPDGKIRKARVSRSGARTDSGSVLDRLYRLHHRKRRRNVRPTASVSGGSSSETARIRRRRPDRCPGTLPISVSSSRSSPSSSGGSFLGEPSGGHSRAGSNGHKK